MDIKKQYSVLGLYYQKRFKIQDNKVISLIGKEPREIKPIVLPSGYIQHQVDIGFNEKLIVYEHHLIYLWYYGTYDPKYVIDHIDGNKQNNNINNLRAVTHLVNIQSSQLLHPAKGRPYKPRLPEGTKQEMIILFKNGLSVAKIAKQFKCNRQNIYVIITNRIGKELYLSILRQNKINRTT